MCGGHLKKILLYLFECSRTAVPVATIIFLLAPQPVHAYIDPGTGGMIIQGLIGLLAGGLVSVGIFWKRITTFLKNRFKRSSHGANKADEEDTTDAGSKGQPLK